MSRPVLSAIDVESELQGWDTDVNDFMNVFSDGPWPVYESAGSSLATLESNFPAANFDRCLAWINDSTRGWRLCVSVGGAWSFLPAGSSSVQLTDSSGGTSGGNTIAAVTDLTTTKNAIATLAAKVNSLL